MIHVEKNQEVAANTNYVTCVEGDFNFDDYVPCKIKNDTEENTVMFLAIQINKTENETSN
jgi:hypothetical protein